MSDAPAIPRIAGLLADPARAAIVWTLIDGTSRPAGELAMRVVPSFPGRIGPVFPAAWLEPVREAEPATSSS